ncbi:MAG: YesL family protein [Oscillospiraceae bacterium]|nr:YesL family protein [Oscillospiraceae bacterium]
MFFPKIDPAQTPKRDPRPVPAGGAGRLWYVLSTHFGKLVTANLLFVLFSVPVVTMPAAFAAMTAVIQALWRQGQCFVWETFWRELRTEFWARTLWSLVLLALPVGGWFLGGLMAVWAAYALSAILLVLVLLAGGYWFAQMGCLTLGCGACLRNALLLAALETKRNFFLLLIEGVTAALVTVFWPFSTPFLFVFLAALMQLLVVAAVNPALDARVVDPEAAV